jgi:DNA topoisomerase-2
MWVLDAESKKLASRPCTFVPGLYKIFDEILVNAADNKQRDPKMNKIDVTICAEDNFIRIRNNGKGIPVAVHEVHNVYVPELIFGQLLTGSNFDDDEEKTTGGRNGYGAKLANIFSTEFVVETADKGNSLKYTQTFRSNMSETGKPTITKYKGEDFTCITFYPDFQRFNMEGLDADIIALMSKRVYDLAGTNLAGGSKLKVTLNSEPVEITNFESYVGCYDGLEMPAAYTRVNDRWEVGVGISDGTFQQVGAYKADAPS